VPHGEWLRFVLLCAGFWSVVLVFRGRARRRGDGVRLLAGLTLGAFLAHLGWALLHPGVVAADPLLLVDPSRGHSVLFVPLGIVLAALPGPGPAGRAPFLSESLGALLPGLALARLGCLAAGCCTGAVVHEAALLLAVAPVLRCAPLRLRPGLALAGLGAARLLVEPWRARAALEPVVPAWLLAAAWLAAGLWLLAAWGPRARSDRSAGARPAGPVFGSAP
jgi:hypothetical protein